LAARLPGTLAEVEAVVGAVEAADSLETACRTLRLEVELPGVLRWTRRRVQAIHTALILIKGLLPQFFEGCEPRLGEFAARLGIAVVLPPLRGIAAPFLATLPAPLGFRPRPRRGGDPPTAFQHPKGADPPKRLA